MSGILAELKRRNVFKIAVFYVVTGWLLLQMADLLFDLLGLPDWTLRFVFGLIALGFPVALIFSWVYEITPEGIKLEKDIDRSESISPQTGRKLNVANGVLLAVAVLLLGFQLLGPDMISDDDAGGEPEVSGSGSVTGGPQTREASIDIEPDPITEKSVAVLPFRNMSPDPDQDYFSEGLADTLIHVLAQIDDLKVAARTSSFSFKDQQIDVREIADKLGVATVLEGSVQKSGNRMRIIAQLIDASDGTHLWSANFDRSADDIFVIQDEIATEVVKALKGALLESESEEIADQYQPTLEAYQAFLKGRQEMAKRSSEGLEAAERHFKRALELDPNYPLALVNLANVYLLGEEHSDRPRPEAIELAEPLLRRAIELDPTLGEAYTSMGLLHDYKNRHEMAMEFFQKGIELAPNYSTAYHWYALRVGGQGRVDEALRLFQKAAELDPLSDIIQANVVGYLAANDRDEEALELVESAMARSPEFTNFVSMRAGLEFKKGNLGRGIYWSKKGVQLDPGKVSYQAGLCFQLLNLPDPSEAEDCIDRVVALAPESDLVVTLQMWNAVLDSRLPDAIELGRTYSETSDLTQTRGVGSVLQTAYALSGQYQRAIELFLTENPELSPQSDASTVDANNWGDAIFLAYLWRQVGEKERASRLVEAVWAIIEGRNRFGPGGIGVSDVELHALEGDYDEAVASLAEAIQEGWFFGWRWQFLHNPILEPLREREDFRRLGEQLQQRLAEQQAWLEAQPPIEIKPT